LLSCEETGEGQTGNRRCYISNVKKRQKKLIYNEELNEVKV
jgi:hypothetical protein